MQNILIKVKNEEVLKILENLEKLDLITMMDYDLIKKSKIDYKKKYA
jgi:hypothetical protein